MRNWVEASYSREREKKKTREMKRFFHVWAQFSAHSLGGLFTRYNRRVKKSSREKIYKGKFDLNLWIFFIHLSIVTSNLREFIVFSSFVLVTLHKLTRKNLSLSKIIINFPSWLRQTTKELSLDERGGKTSK